MNTESLPIDGILSELTSVLRSRPVAVLEAPPGAGKTTRVPLALLNEPWLSGRRIVMLEPRRLAARASARFMARILGESVGETVGYRVRGDSRVSPRTRIEVVTEGVLARLLSLDAALEGYGAVLFDEFHERSIHADLGLALVLETRQHLRPDLRCLVMSATLDGEAVAALISDNRGSAQVVRSEGCLHDIVTHYRPPRSGECREAVIVRVIREALRTTDGDVLVFLPGASEQRRVAESLASDLNAAHGSIRLHVLHGGLPLDEQDVALSPAQVGTRKVVLSTSLAETSLTVEGVRVVVDSGLSRLTRFNVAAGMAQLRTVRVSRASAEQRRGRAGRTAPGVCYRLWDAHEEHALQATTRPEIVDSDLSALALELADAGIADPGQLRWLDVPPAAPFRQARTLLGQLGALDEKGYITSHGRRMVALPLAPRLAHMLLAAADRGAGTAGAAISALLEERDVLRADGRPPVDLHLRTGLLRSGETAALAGFPGVTVDRDALERVRRTMQDLIRRGDSDCTDDTELWSDDDIGALLALAFPDRIAQRRGGAEPRYVLRNGSGAVLGRCDSLHDAPWLAVADMDGQPPEYRILRAAPITPAEIMAAFAEQTVSEPRVRWDDAARVVKATEVTALGALLLSEKPLRDAPVGTVRTAVATMLRRTGVVGWPLPGAVIRLRQRMAFVHRHREGWPDVSDNVLSADMDEWLVPFLDGVRSWADLETLDWHEALLSRLAWQQRVVLDALAPGHIEVPTGSRIALDYSDPDSPVLAVRLQECLGWTATPTLLDGCVPVTMHLLSPAHRPVQVTRDLAGFWKGSYFDVRKELRGRYPRHSWPDDPLSAKPTRRAKSGKR